MKYRRLTNDELQEVESSFVRFLASNSVTADDWVQLKAEKPEKAEELIALFSDIVFEDTLKRIEYLEFKTPKDIKLFHCLETKIEMIGIMVEEEVPIDFTKKQSPEQMLQAAQQSQSELKIYSAEKGYRPNRHQELFKMMEHGCLISDGTLYKTLKGMMS